MQTAIIVLIVNFYSGLNTHEPFLDILVIAVSVAFVCTLIVSTALDLLLRTLRFLSGGTFSTEYPDWPTKP